MNKDCFDELLSLIKISYRIKETKCLLNKMDLILLIGGTEVIIEVYKNENIINSISLTEEGKTMEFNMRDNQISPIKLLLKKLSDIEKQEIKDLKYQSFEKEIKDMLSTFKIVSFYDKDGKEVNYPTIYYKVFDDEFIMSLDLYNNKLCINKEKTYPICKKYSYTRYSMLPVFDNLFGKNLEISWYVK